MGLKRFMDSGLLQEVNREFLHPLGLALSLKINKSTGAVKFQGIWDARHDPEGIIFNEPELDTDDARAKAANVFKMRQEKAPARVAALGYIIQQIPPAKKSDRA